MADPLFAILHVGFGPEVTLLEYLYRVLLHLLAFGGVTLVALWLSDVIGARQTGGSPRSSGEGRGP